MLNFLACVVEGFSPLTLVVCKIQKTISKMEGEICLYNKFGYCWFKRKCKRKHLRTENEDLEDCKNVQSCHKRHPKRCKSYALGNCRFKNSCAYKYHKPTINKDHKILDDKVELLEKVVHALTRKVLSLEEEAEKRKKERYL